MALPKAAGLQVLGGINGGRGIELEFKPSVAVIAGRIDKLGLDIRSFKKPLQKSLKEVIIPSIRTNFDVEGRPRWQGLAETTIKRKKRSSILRETGNLRKVMGQQRIWDVNNNFLILRDLPQNVWYGKVHQAGGSFRVSGGGMNLAAARKYLYGGAGAGKGASGGVGEIPARPFVVLQRQDERKIESIFRHWLQERIDKAMR